MTKGHALLNNQEQCISLTPSCVLQIHERIAQEIDPDGQASVTVTLKASQVACQTSL